MNRRRIDEPSGGGHHTALRGEFRQLTVLFSDLVGFTALSQRCDPEDLNDIVDAFERVCRESVERFGGYLDSFHGDCVLAFFGYPATRGADAEQAIKAAVSIRDGVRALNFLSASSLEVHAGIATGTAAIHIAQGVPKFTGDAINLAARLQSLAEPGEILIESTTRDLVAGMLDLDARGTSSLRGFSQPVPIWSVRSAPSLKEERKLGREAGETPFVGRRRELDILLDRWARATKASGKALSIIGEPGIGKSRLVRRFLASIEQPFHLVGVNCDPQRRNAAFFPYVAHLQDSAGARWEDPPETKLSLVREFMRLPSSDETAAWLSRVLGIDPGPTTGDSGRLRQRIIKHLISYFTALAEKKPLILLVEDAQWIDPSSAELTARLANELKDAPALIVLTSRSARPSPKLEPVMEYVTLGRLTEQESADLVVRLAGKGTLDLGRVSQIVTRTEGHPLFLEELTRAVSAESLPGSIGADQDSDRLLPASIQQSVLTRLDQLSSAKSVAQIASVLGHEFELGELQQLLSEPPAMVRKSLIILLRSGLIYPVEANRYAFHHAIVRDGAYFSLLRKDRRELHRRVAELLQEKDEAGVNFADIIAHHYAEAGAIDRSIQFRIAAARQWLQRAANFEVIGHAVEALKLVPRLQDERTRLDYELTLELLRGAAFWAVEGFSSVQVEAAFSRANELAEILADPVRQFVAVRGLFGCYYGRGQLPRAFQEATSVIALAEKTGSRGDMCIGQMLAGQITLWRGQLVASREHLEQSLSLYNEEEQRVRMLSSQIDPAVNAGIHLGWTLWTLGLPDSALAVTDAALSSARRIGQPFGLAMALFWAAVLRLWRGERDVANAQRLELCSVTSEHNISYLSASATVLDGEQLISEGHIERGVETILSGLAHFEQQRGGLGWPWAMSLIADGYRQAGRHKDALSAVQGALSAVRRNEERHWESELHRLRGMIILDSEGPSRKAARALSRSLAIARAQHAGSLEIRALRSVAHLYLLRGQRAEALRIARSASGNVIEGHGTGTISEFLNFCRDLEAQLLHES